jgi:hypothetical protein
MLTCLSATIVENVVSISDSASRCIMMRPTVELVYTSKILAKASLSSRSDFGSIITLTAKALHDGIQIQGSRFRSRGCLIGMGPSQRQCLVPRAISDHYEFHNLA